VEQIIRDNGLKKRAVAEKAGFTQNEFSAMLHGRKLILAEHVIALCKALNKTPNDLYGMDTGNDEIPFHHTTV
jgi:plasmid maintenance system antidote protein VapI